VAPAALAQRARLRMPLAFAHARFLSRGIEVCNSVGDSGSVIGLGGDLVIRLAIKLGNSAPFRLTRFRGPTIYRPRAGPTTLTGTLALIAYAIKHGDDLVLDGDDPYILLAAIADVLSTRVPDEIARAVP
jgi:hypothetical protein